jgi:diguanylate cyclase (GGDEF)-like protein
VRDEADAVAVEWRELCAWDPELPPDTEPPATIDVVLAVADALRRSQPLGWGVDPVVEHAVSEFSASVESVELAIGELVCLREAIARHLEGKVPGDEEDETRRRLEMITSRAMGAAARSTVARLRYEAYADPLTGLLNRRAFERDVRREVSRARRHGRAFTVVLTDLDGLKLANDTKGHNAGDFLLRAMAGALNDALRAGDAAYRVGGDEFTMLLTDTDATIVSNIVARLKTFGAPAFGWGAASFPDDGPDLVALLERADHLLIERRGRGRGRTGGGSS